MATLLCMPGCEYGSKQGYTLRRLSVSERSVFAWQGVYNILCFFMLWAFQTLIAYALCKLYLAKVDSALTSVQTVFLASYRNAFLHSLLPLSEVSRWIRNILLVTALGLSTAIFPYMQRRGKVGRAAIFMTALAVVFFSRSMSSFGNDLVLILASAIMIASSLGKVLLYLSQ